MAQNPYNNYIKRKAQSNVGVNPSVAPKPNNNPSVGFKKRVIGNIGGGDSVTNPKPQNTSSQTVNQFTAPTQHTPQANISQPEPIQPINNTNTPVAPVQPVTDVPTAPGNNTVMPLEVDNAPEMFTSNVMQEQAEINAIAEEVANNPMMQRQAMQRGKTPQQYAQELYEQQKAQLQKDWEIKQKELAMQQEQAQKAHESSIADTDKKYGETVDLMNQNRYEQMEDLNISGSNRGIQYSPQQLGLEQVANIGHNKNLAEASKQRNEMLTELNKKMMELSAQMTLGSQNAMNEYNKSLGQLSAQYNEKLMNWEYDKVMTDEERAWQEAQTQKDREWQEAMDKANKDWQSKENALDREKGRSSGGGGGGWSPYSSWKGKKGWKNWGGSSDWKDYGSNGFEELDLSDQNQANVYRDEFRKESTDVYNELKTGWGLRDVNDRAQIYTEMMDEQLRQAKGAGLKDDVFNDLVKNTRGTALKHMFNNSYEWDTGGYIDKGSNGKDGNRGRIKERVKIPWSEKHKDNMRAQKETRGYDFGSKFAYSQDTRDFYDTQKGSMWTDFRRNQMEKVNEARDRDRNGIKHPKPNTSNNNNNDTSKMKESVKKSMSNTSKSKANAKENAKTSVSKAKDNVKKSTSNAKENAKKSTSKAKENVKKSTSKAKSNSKSSIKKSLNNFKKNIGKAFKKKR